jgi:hypothetical protein
MRGRDPEHDGPAPTIMGLPPPASSSMPDSPAGSAGPAASPPSSRTSRGTPHWPDAMARSGRPGFCPGSAATGSPIPAQPVPYRDRPCTGRPEPGRNQPGGQPPMATATSVTAPWSTSRLRRGSPWWASPRLAATATLTPPTQHSACTRRSGCSPRAPDWSPGCWSPPQRAQAPPAWRSASSASCRAPPSEGMYPVPYSRLRVPRFPPVMRPVG